MIFYNKSAYYSYVMGIDKNILELKKRGFCIEKRGDNYVVAFTKDKADVWENFIANNLQEGYWNEYITLDKIIFMFCLNGKINRYEVSDFESDEVLQLCETLCDCKFGSLKAMLVSNSFYKRILHRRFRISK